MKRFIMRISEFIDTPVRQLLLGSQMRGNLLVSMLHFSGHRYKQVDEGRSHMLYF